MAVSTLAVGDGQQAYFRLGDVVRLASTGEAMHVRAINNPIFRAPDSRLWTEWDWHEYSAEALEARLYFERQEWGRGGSLTIEWIGDEKTKILTPKRLRRWWRRGF